jgi:hypothetical protein
MHVHPYTPATRIYSNSALTSRWTRIVKRVGKKGAKIQAPGRPGCVPAAAATADLGVCFKSNAIRDIKGLEGFSMVPVNKIALTGCPTCCTVLHALMLSLLSSFGCAFRLYIDHVNRFWQAAPSSRRHLCRCSHSVAPSAALWMSTRVVKCSMAPAGSQRATSSGRPSSVTTPRALSAQTTMASSSPGLATVVSLHCKLLTFCDESAT